jgi:hypothetical protein
MHYLGYDLGNMEVQELGFAALAPISVLLHRSPEYLQVDTAPFEVERTICGLNLTGGNNRRIDQLIR